ncbi:glycosyltransferase involved in cell wall biosynthesis [Wenyingzhuangia heitensis]|uniref:Glycosyltransferase involved in cell wall biosynthesis n=1 Tax=Wenyingzhuangia heitensis TaxID=1487859 RepID=A0ABX0UCF8_9FLAO|nr:glycosyltransferase family 4 protein [Wenyingzhuangia heitensis]NIJ46023.1 glycosyltransferase involved in cell wall biosynthesis [Wenyingzhuangia heitensis]
MRIGMILDKTFPPDVRVENEAETLVKQGHDVFLFCLKYNDEQLDDELINGIKVCRYSSSQLEYKLSALAYTVPFYTWLMTQKIKSFIKKNQIEALHIHDIRIADAVFKANKKSKLKIVLDLHDNMPEIMQFYPHLQKFPGKYIISLKKWKVKEEEFIRKADKVITVSPEFVDEVVNRTKIASDKIVLVPNTIRKSFYQDAIIEVSIIEKYKDSFVILYLGDTHLRRGLQTAISAIKNVSKEIENVKLVIVGSNTTDAVLKQQTKDLEVEKYVDFEGWQNVALFPSYIKASTICISPLHRNIQHDVAYANKLFQYMSFEKSVLVSNATAQKTLIEKVDAGWVHADRDVADFTQKIIEIFKDVKGRHQKGKNGSEFVKEEFIWEKTSQKLVELYNQL